MYYNLLRAEAVSLRQAAHTYESRATPGESASRLCASPVFGVAAPYNLVPIWVEVIIVRALFTPIIR